MYPVDFPESNMIIHSVDGAIPARRLIHPNFFTTLWAMDSVDLQSFYTGEGRLWVHVMGDVLPKMMLSTCPLRDAKVRFQGDGDFILGFQRKI